MRVTYLTTQELADRWKMSADTLRNWRFRRCGPPYTKIGAKALYELRDVERYENEKKKGPGE